MERKLFIYIINRMLATEFFAMQKTRAVFYHVKFPLETCIFNLWVFISLQTHVKSQSQFCKIMIGFL